MRRLIHIVLPETTVRAIDLLAKPGERSRFIDRAVRHFVDTQSQEALRQRLEHAALRDRDLDREVAADWVAVDQQAWKQLDEPKQPRSRSTAKSTSRRSTRQ